MQSIGRSRKIRLLFVILPPRTLRMPAPPVAPITPFVTSVAALSRFRLFPCDLRCCSEPFSAYLPPRALPAHTTLTNF